MTIVLLLKSLARATAEVSALRAQNQQLHNRVQKLEEELALARLHRFAPRSEKRKDRALNEAEQIADAEGDVSCEDDIEDAAAPLPDTGLPPSASAEGKKRGRKPLPDHLPRERVEYDIPEDQKSCPCCSTRMHRMGETVSEQLHIEVKAKVLQNVRFKYACLHCDRTGITTPVITAPRLHRILRCWLGSWDWVAGSACARWRGYRPASQKANWITP